MSLVFVDTELARDTPPRFAGHMHPRCAVRYWQPVPPARRSAAAQHLRDLALAFFLGSAGAALLFVGLSGGFRP